MMASEERHVLRGLGEIILASPRFATAPLIRRRHLRWGATDAEVAAPMPGDELVPRSSFTATRAITIDAPPEAVWPWLVQLGYRRAGWYTYDLFDNAGYPSADRILPQYQNLKVGDRVPMAKNVNETTAFWVVGMEPNHSMLWQKPNSTWAWKLDPLEGNRSRLITRLKALYTWRTSPGNALLSLILFEFGDFPMTRKLLLGVKRRAEQLVKDADRARNGTERSVPVFQTEETRAELMAIYDEALRQWPVTYETSFLPTRYGQTHVIASGDPASPPLVMTHPAAVGGFVWSSIIASLSERRRVYALDTIGDVGRSELADPDRYPKTGSDYSAWLDDVYEQLEITQADIVAGSMGGWIAMHHAIYAPSHVRRLVLLGPMGLSPWRANLAVIVPFAWYAMRPTDAKFERIIFRALGGGERVNREFRPWMLIMGKCKPKTGQPFHLSSGKLRLIKAPTLVILGGKDGLVGSATAAARRARTIPSCQIEILPQAGHIMSVDEPEFVGERIVKFLEAENA